MWDFDSDIASPKLNGTQVLGAPIRAYYQNPNAQPDGGAPGGLTVIDAQPGRWSAYVPRAPGDPAEVPPLPPEGTNSNPDSTKNGSGSSIHHLIRDFMFLDAAANNAEAGPTPTVAPRVGPQFTVRFRPLKLTDPDVADDSALGQFTRGTGRQQVANKYLLDTATAPVTGSGNLAFLHDDPTIDPNNPNSGLSFATLLYELINLQTNEVEDGSQSSPNWFGVAVSRDITDFTNVIIYFHPTPGQAGYVDLDYPSKTNGSPPNPAHTYWKELLGYVDRLGGQLAGAVKHSNATANQIVIVPLMRNGNLDGGQPVTAGILPRQWYYIVNDILKDIPTRLTSPDL